ncbi:MAG: ABC transporter ATP-binding protein [Clostridiales bacterium]|nr:ABC transporter ATP-binding protein [Clostridiales bacterium]
MIHVENLSFSYRRKEPVLQNISFSVSQGEIFGILGPSGAGKSTLMKILIGLLPDYKGKAMVMNQNCNRLKGDFFSRVGVDFEVPALFERFTARENLQFFASLHRRPCFKVDDLLTQLGLMQAEKQKVSTFSKGMKTRLSFARAVINNPDLIFLDEPTDGLDPTSAASMKGIIKGLRQQGKTIILTTHNMQDATDLCDRVAFLSSGQIAALNTPRSLIMAQGAANITYTFVDNGVEQTRTTPLNRLSEDDVLSFLVKSNRITSIHSDEPNLANVFTEVTGGRLE